MQKINFKKAVFTAFCDVTGMDRQTALRLSSSFGAGMGRLRQTCGAVSAMCMVAGMLYGFGERKELETAGADFIAADNDELFDILTQ